MPTRVAMFFTAASATRVRTCRRATTAFTARLSSANRARPRRTPMLTAVRPAAAVIARSQIRRVIRKAPRPVQAIGARQRQVTVVRQLQAIVAPQQQGIIAPAEVAVPKAVAPAAVAVAVAVAVPLASAPLIRFVAHRHVVQPGRHGGARSPTI